MSKKTDYSKYIILILLALSVLLLIYINVKQNEDIIIECKDLGGEVTGSKYLLIECWKIDESGYYYKIQRINGRWIRKND